MPLAARAQGTDPWLRYQAEKKSEFAAAALEAIIPLLGHAYAGDWRTGIVLGAVSGAGFVAMIVGANLRSNCHSSFGFEVCEAGLRSAALLGMLAYLVGRAWSIVSSLSEVRTYNQRLMDRLGCSLNDVDLKIRPSPAGVSVGLAGEVPMRKKLGKTRSELELARAIIEVQKKPLCSLATAV